MCRNVCCCVCVVNKTKKQYLFKEIIKLQFHDIIHNLVFERTNLETSKSVSVCV